MQRDVSYWEGKLDNTYTRGLGGVVVCSWDSDAEVAGSILGVGFSAQPDHNNP